MRCLTRADPMKSAPPVTKIFMQRSVRLSKVRTFQRRERMAIIAERTREFLEHRKSPILVGDDDVSVLQRPWKRNVRIVPANPAIVCRCGDFIHHNDVVLQSEESVGKAYGNVNLAPGFGREFCRNILTKRRRAASYIHGHIENSPLQDGDQLRLGRRRKLEM
jgi:hypothetical protein